MLLRVALAALGIVELAFAKPFTDFWMDLAAEGDVELRPWVYAVVRAEGAVFVLWALWGLLHRCRGGE